MTLVDPFSLYVIVLDELWLQAESMMNRVREVFGFMERVRLTPFLLLFALTDGVDNTNILGRARPVLESSNWREE